MLIWRAAFDASTVNWTTWAPIANLSNAAPNPPRHGGGQGQTHPLMDVTLPTTGPFALDKTATGKRKKLVLTMDANNNQNYVSVDAIVLIVRFVLQFRFCKLFAQPGHDLSTRSVDTRISRVATITCSSINYCCCSLAFTWARQNGTLMRHTRRRRATWRPVSGRGRRCRVAVGT